MALIHLEKLAVLTTSRAEKVTVFMGNYYVEKTTCLAAKVTFQDVCHLETSNNPLRLF